MNFYRDRFTIAIFVLLLAGCNGSDALHKNEGTPTRDAKENPSLLDYRLPQTIIPTNYEIILIPQLEGSSAFKGVVHIKAHTREATDTITLHHGRIEIAMVSVRSKVQMKEIVKSTYNNETEKFELKLSEVLKAGTNITISFEYTGVIRDDMVGLYKSSYIDANGTIRSLVSTQFQTKHARHAFPCFDEPRFKASFIIRLLRPEGYNCLSNMPLNRSVKVDDKYWDEFKQSIPMSTYLVAFVISDFKSLQVGDFKVWARPNAIEQARYALSIGTQALDYFSKRFKLDYQMPKMDMVAVPDFSMGAMENWGLVTYRESRLLYDENTSSDAAQQSIAAVIVHELTHMWFGNTITPEWWSYLWLSEAFARYFQYFATAQIEKTWDMEAQFVVEQHQTAYAADGVETSEPMTREISNSVQLAGVGDSITYNKGGSIVRMMRFIFGPDAFDAGLQNYLRNEQKVARPVHLWTALQNEIDRRHEKLAASVEKVMTTWTEQPGFPVVSVSIKDGTATLEQKRFLLRNLKSTATNVTWWVPITWTTKENPNFSTINVSNWLSKERDTINIGKTSDWVVFNVQSSGFYRVNYDNASWYRIIDTLRSKDYQDIHVINRAALIDDLLNLARAGLLPYKTALDGLRYLEQEKDYLPFKAAFYGLTYLDQRLSGHSEYYTNLKEFLLTLINNRYEQIGYVDRPSDDRLMVLLRGELNKWACNYGHKKCVDTFTRMFQQWKEHGITIKPNQRPIAYCMGIKYGTKDDWEFLWNQYYNSNSATEQVVILQALGCTENVTLLENYLGYALRPFKESRIRMQDNSAVFSAVYASGVSGAEVVLNFVAKHYAEMIAFYNGTETISSMLSSASQHFSTQQSVDKFESLIEQRKVEFAPILKSLRDSLAVAKYELQWLKSNANPIMSWVIDFNTAHRDNATNDTSETTSYRLPTNIKPNAYDISVRTNLSQLDNFGFKGTVKINATVATKTKTIVLHSANLIHDDISVLVENRTVAVLRSSKNEKYDFLSIELGQELQAGQELLVSINFAGNLSDEMRGFYKSSYEDEDGNRRWLAATHMEPVAARKMFPCFDEPALKAVFAIRVTVPIMYNANSNMPPKEVYLNRDETKTIVFKETPKMSTYLVVLVVSDFASIKDEDEIYGVWARQSAIDQGKYALSVMGPLVKHYENALDFPYQLPKLDMFALPDFVSGAMENWGLLTYKERNVLYDSALSSAAAKQTTLNIISHEITHQWFGNLVSPLWWKYLWLNEGFARYFQYFGSNSVQGNWSLASQFVVEQIHTAFEADSASSTHAMSHDVYSPTQISAIFDSISYAKAASVIRMMEKTFGSDVFYKALQNYLKKRQYDVATPDDLFESFKEQITDPQLKNSSLDILNSWTTQPGYPVVYVTVQGKHLALKQERFFLKAEESTSPITWYVPITWTPLSKPNFEDTKPKYWLKDAQGSVDLPSEDLYLLNVQQSGYYRTNYDTQTWRRIITFLKSDQFETAHEINRASIIDDLLNLGRSGYVDYDIVLSATEYLSKETNYIPWRAFFNGLSYLHKQFEGRNSFGAFKRYVASILNPIYTRIQFDDNVEDTHVTKLFRAHVRKWACKLDIGSCRTTALEYFTLLQQPNTKLPVDDKSVLYCTAASLNIPLFWESLWDMYYASTFPAEKSAILQSFACATEKTLLNQLLEKAISKGFDIRLEDSSSVFTSVINASPEGAESVMDFVKDNYDKMISYFNQVSTIDSIVSAIGRRVYTDEHYVKYVELLNWLEEKRPATQDSLGTFANFAGYELKWAEDNIPKLSEWLERNYPATNYRLPKMFVPLKYNISLAPYFEERNFTFSGRVQIEIKRMENYVSRIVLHAAELEINKLSVYPKAPNSSKEEITSFLLNNDTEMLTIFMKKFIKSEDLILDIEFTGSLNDEMIGFYRSHYVNSEGKVRWLATTQFQATYARKAFPCFDEPAMKATFVINIERPKDYVVLSNMPRALLTPSDAPDRVWESFKETPKMSTYLVAFVVSDFNPVINSNEFVNVWGRSEIAEKGELAQISAMRIINYLFLETGHQYTLPKLDLVGIPDFSMGAMENWGLATFREYGLFYDKSVTTAKYTDYIFTIIAHELAHMIYGNLVTCDWWEYIWLNEGFAEYMQWRLAHLVRPSFGYEDLFVVDELQAAMQEDDTESTHPMNNPVKTPDEIDATFDAVTYGKSSSVIRMIQKSLKPNVFSLAVYQYISKHKYGTVRPKDLWDAFDFAISQTNGLGDWNISMADIMFGWTNERSYPIVEATLNGNHLKLTQRNFYNNHRSNDFIIPITLTTASEKNFKNTWTDVWLTGESLKIYIEKPEEWFLLNIQQSGYYRVNYDPLSWSRLLVALRQEKYSEIHVTNRAQIIDDLLNLARAGYLDYNITLNGTLYLQNETEYLPWKAFFNGLNFIVRRVENQPEETLVKRYTLLLADGLYRKLGFVDNDTEAHFDQLSRELILTWMCKLGHKQCIDKAVELFKTWRRNSTLKISPNARPAVYCTAIKYGTQEDWDFLWQEYLHTNFASEMMIILQALGCSRDKEILNTYIKFALTGNITSSIRKQDINTVLASVYNSGEFGVNLILEILVNDYKKIQSYGNWELVKQLITNIGPRISTKEQIAKLNELYDKIIDVPDVLKALKSANETATNNLDWYQKNSYNLRAWLNTRIPMMEDLGNASSRLVANKLSIIWATVLTIIVYMLGH